MISVKAPEIMTSLKIVSPIIATTPRPDHGVRGDLVILEGYLD